MSDQERRRFAVPPAQATVDGIDLSLLDPSDPDERRILIEAEHPELRDALDGGEGYVEVEGEIISPGLHIAMHEIVAGQLWEGEPPETWETAQRLAAGGYHRHEVLHMIASVVSHETWRMIEHQEPFDHDRFVAGLEDLPDSWESERRADGDDVRYEFDAVDEDWAAFETTRDQLVDDFVEWLGDRGDTEVEPDVAQSALDMKVGYLDGNLIRWQRHEVVEYLLDLVPRKVVGDDAYLAAVPNSLVAFLTFLDERGLLRGDPLPRLVETVEELLHRYEQALEDPTNWGMGKRLFAAMGDPDLDLDSQEALGEIMGRFNELPFAERDAILSGLPSPAIVLPPDDQLEGAAERSPALGRTRTFVGFVGDGRRLTDNGNLRLADGRELVELLDTHDRVDERIGEREFKTRSTRELPGVDRTYRVAREAGFVHVRHGKVVPTRSRLDMLTDDPLAAVMRLFTGLLEVGPTAYRWRDNEWFSAFWDEELDSSIVGLLLALHDAGAPLPIEDLAASKWEHVEELFDLVPYEDDRIERWRDMFERDLRSLLDDLVELGFVEISDEVREAGEFGLVRRSGGAAAITDLGRLAVSRITGAPTRQAGELRELDATRLLAAAAELEPDEASAEIRIWCAERGHDTAARQLAEAAIGADTDTVMMAFAAFDELAAEDAEPAVRRLIDDASVGPFARLWLVDHGLEDDSIIDPATTPDALVRVLSAIIRFAGPEAAAEQMSELGPAEEQRELIGDLWRLDLPEVETVLETLGDHLPDKATAKAARKALFKHRTSRTSG